MIDHVDEPTCLAKKESSSLRNVFANDYFSQACSSAEQRFCGSSLHRVEAHGRLCVADATVAEDVVGVVEDELLREDVVEIPE